MLLLSDESFYYCELFCIYLAKVVFLHIIKYQKNPIEYIHYKKSFNTIILGFIQRLSIVHKSFLDKQLRFLKLNTSCLKLLNFY